MKVYRGADGDLMPEPIDRPDGFDPQQTSTLFATEAEAWDSIVRGVDAGVKLAARYVERAREEVRKAEKHAADVAIEYRTVRDNYMRWKERQSR